MIDIRYKVKAGFRPKGSYRVLWRMQLRTTKRRKLTPQLGWYPVYSWVVGGNVRLSALHKDT